MLKSADIVVLSLYARELEFFPRHFQNCGDILAGVDLGVMLVKKAMALRIPLSKLMFYFVSLWSNELTQLVRDASRVRKLHRRLPSAETWRAYLKALSAKGAGNRKAKAVHIKQAVADAA